jgi:LmbE family N-acetylglucosaminyl deacetylase
MGMLYTQNDVKKLGTILGIWAHPDDEVFSCSGLMHAACLNGQKVISITATYGDAGESADDSKWPKKDLGKIRKKESEAALSYIGNIEQHWLGYGDGKINAVNADGAVDKIMKIIELEKIHTILTFEEQGITGHEDHKTVHRWSAQLAKKLGIENVLCSVETQEYYESHGKELDKKHNIYYNVDKPNCVCRADADVCFELPEEFRKIKLAALKAHESQTSQLFASLDGKQAVKALVITECYVYV